MRLLLPILLVCVLACGGLPVLPSFDHWEPDDVQARLERDGWQVRSCYDSTDRDLSMVMCSAKRDGWYAEVIWLEYARLEDARFVADDERTESDGIAVERDYKTVLTVEVSSPQEARDLLAEIEGADASRKSLVASLEEAGWTAGDCSSGRMRKRSEAECEATRKGRQATAWVSRGTRPPRGKPRRRIEDGAAVWERGSDVVMVKVSVAGESEALLDRLVAVEGQ